MVFKKKLRPTGSKKGSSSSIRKFADKYGLDNYKGSRIGVADTTDFMTAPKYNPMANLPEAVYRHFVNEDLYFNQIMLRTRANYEMYQKTKLLTTTKELQNARDLFVKACICKYSAQYARLGLDAGSNAKLFSELVSKIKSQQGIDITRVLSLDGKTFQDFSGGAQLLVSNACTKYQTAFNTLATTNGWAKIAPITTASTSAINMTDSANFVKSLNATAGAMLTTTV